MEPNVLLTKTVMRQFYDSEHIVLVDLLLRSGEQSEDKLAEMMHLTCKQINKAATLLRDDGFLQAEARQEFREYDGKQITRVYWRLDLDMAFISTRTRIQRMVSSVEQQLRATVHGEAQGYQCPQCLTTYGLLDVNRIVDPHRGILICEVCSRELSDRDEIGGDQTELTDLYQRLMHETKPLTSILKQIEARQREKTLQQVQQQRQLEQRQSTEREQEGTKLIPTFTEIKTVSPTKELPKWHSHSTVSGEMVVKDTSKSTKPTSKLGSRSIDQQALQVQDYYASILKRPPENISEREELVEVESQENVKKKAKLEELVEKIESQLESIEQKNEKEEEEEVAEIVIMAGGKSVPLVAVTEADRASMTPEENAAYLEAYSNLFGDI